MANVQFDNNTSVQALVGAVQANSVELQTIATTVTLDTLYESADIANGLLMICNVTDGDLGLFPLVGGVVGTAVLAGTDFTPTKDTAAKVNLFVDTGTIQIQNNLPADKEISLSIIAAGVDFK